MIQKCANPDCGAEFLRASRGRLFSFDITNLKQPASGAPVHPAAADRRTIFFWLCDACAPRFTVEFTPELGFHAKALDKNAPAASYYTEERALPPMDGQKTTSQLDQKGSAEYFCPNCSRLAHGSDR